MPNSETITRGVSRYHESHGHEPTFWTTSRSGNKLVKVAPDLVGNRGYLGVEVEIDRHDYVGSDERNEVANRIMNLCDGRVTCERDGSLCNGFELISDPMTLAAHRINGWDGIFDAATEAGYVSHEMGTCGLHVHVSKAFLGMTDDTQQLCIAKILLLTNRFFEDYLVPFSRRDMRHLSQWAGKNTEFGDTSPVSSKSLRNKAKLANATSGRYRAVNLKNAATIEFRLFRGTLKHTTFMATLELVCAICEYCKTHTNQACSSVGFGELVTGSDASYTSLRDYCENRGLI